MNDKQRIDELSASFFSIFTNTNGRQPDFSAIHRLCLPETIIIKKSGLAQDVYTPDTFIEPRKKILSDGTLSSFEEWEIGEETSISGHIAQRASQYQKAGCMNGIYFEARGRKFFQFIKTADGWRICALIWEDE